MPGFFFLVDLYTMLTLQRTMTVYRGSVAIRDAVAGIGITEVSFSAFDSSGALPM